MTSLKIYFLSLINPYFGIKHLTSFPFSCKPKGTFTERSDKEETDANGNGTIDCLENPRQWSMDVGGNGHWYDFIANDQAYESHAVDARARGAHMVTLTSLAENTFVEQVRDDEDAEGAYFAGGLRIGDGPDDWAWTTGETWDFTNWGENEPGPNNRLGVPWLNGGTWEDIDSTTQWFAVHEWSADCNGDGIVDYGQILDGTFADEDGNGVPDHCESNPQDRFIGFDAEIERVDDLTVVRMYAVYDESNAAALNVYNRNITTTDGIGFLHNDFLNDQGGNWKPSWSLDIEGVCDSATDSYVTIGYGVGDDATLNQTSLDPNFGDGFGPFIPSLAGWFNRTPANPQFAEPFAGGYDGITGHAVQVGQFVFETARFEADPINFFIFSGEMGSNTGPGTSTFFDIDTFTYGSTRDCDENGVIDTLEIVDGTAADCDGNGIPDSCDIAAGTLEDTNDDGVPDICLPPCPNEDGVIEIPAELATIAEALACAVDGDVILVGPGTYLESIDFAGRAITIESTDGPEATIIDGTGLETSIVLATGGEGDDSILRGFTLRNGTSGSTPIKDPESTEGIGGALYCFQSSPTVEDCIFSANSADYGGAIFVRDGSPTIENCTFDSNSAGFDGGAIQLSISNADIDACIFSGNLAGRNGGALHMVEGAPRISDSTMFDNSAGVSGGAISWSPSGDSQDDAVAADIRNCTITCNTADSQGAGGGIWIETPEDDSLGLLNTEVCWNLPDNVSGSYQDLGDNTICSCPGDLTGDGVIDGADLTILLGDWGTDSCQSDITGDGLVDGADLTTLLGDWGDCN